MYTLTLALRKDIFSSAQRTALVFRFRFLVPSLSFSYFVLFQSRSGNSENDVRVGAPPATRNNSPFFFLVVVVVVVVVVSPSLFFHVLVTYPVG